MGFKPPETTVDGKLHRIKLTIPPAILKQKGNSQFAPAPDITFAD